MTKSRQEELTELLDEAYVMLLRADDQDERDGLMQHVLELETELEELINQMHPQF